VVGGAVRHAQLQLNVAAIATLNDLLQYLKSTEDPALQVFADPVQALPRPLRSLNALEGPPAPVPDDAAVAWRRARAAGSEQPGTGQRGRHLFLRRRPGPALTSDRPIAGCTAKEQRVLNKDGSLKMV
jgi:hypothetical protein